MLKDLGYKIIGWIATLLGPLWPFKDGVQGDDAPDGWKAPVYDDETDTSGMDMDDKNA